MDVNNAYLKRLLDRTDVAFQALMREPESAQLFEDYELARSELSEYLALVKSKPVERIF